MLSPSAPARRRRASAAQAMRIRRALMWACTALACVATYRVSSQPSAGDSTLAMFDGAKSSATFTSRRDDGVDVMRRPTPSSVSSSMGVGDAFAREGGDAEREVVSTPTPTSTSRGRLLTLSTHGALMTFDIDTKKSTVVHEGRGVYYGIFPADVEEAGDEAASTGPHGRGHLAYVASRPDNADITSPLTDSLLLIDLEKGVLFHDFPPVLQIQLKRFEYDFHRDTMVKIHDRYEFPEELDLDVGDRKYLVPEADKSVRNKYRLHSVLVHSGGINGGALLCVHKARSQGCRRRAVVQV